MVKVRPLVSDVPDRKLCLDLHEPDKRVRQPKGGEF